jgi:hypothetical protein
MAFMALAVCFSPFSLQWVICDSGISRTDAFILRSVAAYLNKPTSATSLIVLHLGSGASACAIRNGDSVNVSMGLTPLSGLPGGTRSGNVDPSLIFHYTADAGDVGRMSHDRAKSMHLTEVCDDRLVHLALSLMQNLFVKGREYLEYASGMESVDGNLGLS